MVCKIRPLEYMNRIRVWSLDLAYFWNLCLTRHCLEIRSLSMPLLLATHFDVDQPYIDEWVYEEEAIYAD